MKRFSTFVLLIAAASARAETAASTLTFDEALKRALEVNPTIGRARAEITAAESARRALFSAVLPRLSVTGNLVENSEQVSFGSGTDSRTILPQNDWNYRATINQPIYAGNRERRAYEQGKIGVLNAREGARAAVDGVLLGVASNYFAAVEADELIGVEKTSIELAERRHKQATDFYTAGESTRVDVIRAETAIQTARRRLAAAEQARENAVGALRVQLLLDGPIEVAAPKTTVPSLPDENALVDLAAAKRPELREAENNVRIAELEVRKQRGAYLPVVTADAGYITQKSSFPTDKYGYGALRFTIPIYQGGEIAARVAAAKARELQAGLERDEMKQSVREDVHRAVVDLQTAETNLALARDQLKGAEAEYEQVFALYRAQEATSLDVSESERSLIEARRAVVSGELDLNLAQLGVWYAAGSLESQLTGEVIR